MATKDIIEIKRPEIVDVNLRIAGDTPLIMHRWSDKAKRMMLEKQMGKKLNKKENKNPVEDFICSMYWMTDRPTEFTEAAFEEAIQNGAKFGFPVTAIKQAAISSAYRCGMSKDKVSLQGAFFIKGTGEELLEEVKYDEAPIMREDMVRVGMGTADIRFRGQFNSWYMDLTISYNKAGAYALEDIINLISLGGYNCGIGEWRPEKGGQNGMYHVECQ